MLWALVALGSVVINELLYDPPGVDGGREFVELINTSAAPVPIAALALEAGDGARPGLWRPVWRGTAGELHPGALLVVGGDSLPSPERLTADLQNGPDALRLVGDGTVVDLVGYGGLQNPALYEGRPASDVAGQSLGRRPDGRDTDDNGADLIPQMPSPGRRNAPRRDLEVTLVEPDPVLAWPGRAQRAALRLRNRGGEPVSGWSLHAALREAPYDADAPARPIEVQVTSHELAAGDSLVAPLVWSSGLGLWRLEGLVEPADEDSINDRTAVWVRIGAGSVLVNEILFAPAPGAPEWVELLNRDTIPHDLGGFTLTDQSGRAARLATAVLLPGGFAVASADPLAEIAGLLPGTLRISAVPWNALNNTDGDDGFAEKLVLRDAAGVVQDAVRYSAEWGRERGRSLERLVLDPDVRGLLWAPSKSPDGATPGRENSAAAPPGQALRLVLAPNPFSPDGDGREDALGATLDVPAGYDGFRARIYDLDGRLRATLGADRLGPGPRHLVWEGRDQDGSLLEKGFYVFELELNSKERPRLQERRVVGVVRR
jgi:hypothetical protein